MPELFSWNFHKLAECQFNIRFLNNIRLDFDTIQFKLFQTGFNHYLLISGKHFCITGIQIKMYIAIKHCCRSTLPKLARYLSTNATHSNKLIFENLQHRCLLRVSGNEVFEFLQGLITNDINHVKDASSDNAMYTMFLNKPGRVLFDAIIFKRHNDINSCLIECDRAVENDLKKHLMMFRVRKKINIESTNDELSVWAGFRNDCSASASETQNITTPKKTSDSVIACLDPRLNQLGVRFVAPSSFDIGHFQEIYENVECVTSNEKYDYTEHRYVHGVSEGSIEIPPTKIFPFEANCDFLHGISFHKGCYLGQEFTARTYHTGVIRRRIMPLLIETEGAINFAFDTPISNETDQSIGKLKGIRNKHAIATLRIDQALSSNSLKIGTFIASTYRPSWWAKKS